MISLADNLPPFAELWPRIDAVPGFLVPGQERWLFNAVAHLPEDAVIVEIGSFLGRSTTAMAFACRGTRRRIHAIDTFKGNDSDFIKGKNNVSWEGDDYLETFKAHLAQNGLLDHVIPHQGLSHEVAKTWSLPIDFAFVDGSHVYEDVLRDFEEFYPWLKPGARIAFHDVLPDWEGPYRAWNDHIRERLDQPSQFFSIASGLKPVDARVGEARVHVIVPVHNRVSMTRACLKHLHAQSLIDRLAITVVDDGSTDGTGAMLAEEFPDVRVIEGDGRLFWTGAVARALDRLRPAFRAGDFFLLINNDSRLSPETVEMLINISESRGRAGVSPVAIAGDQAISTGWAPHTSPLLNNFERQFETLATEGNTLEVRSLFGRCSLFPVEVLDLPDVGNYDAENFPHYFGDSDFCLRARRSGFRFFVTGATCIRVVEQQKTTGSHYGFRQGPQPLRKVYQNMTSVKSIDNLPATWAYMRRHHRNRMFANTIEVAWRSLRQWWPIYKGLRLKPIGEPGTTPLTRRKGVRYYTRRVLYYLFHPFSAVEKAAAVMSRKDRFGTAPAYQPASAGPERIERGE